MSAAHVFRWKPESLGPTESEEKFIIESMVADTIAAKVSANAITSSSITKVFNGAIRHNKAMVRAGFILGSKIHIKMSGIETTAKKPNKRLLARSPKVCTQTLAKFIVTQGTELALHGGNNKWFKVLHWAVETQNHEMLVFALNKGANINQKDHFGETALHIASSKGDISIVEILLKKGADVNAEDESGAKPLHYAVIHWESKAQELIRKSGGNRNPKIIWLLIEKAIDVGYVGAGGTPLLHFAVMYKHQALITALLKNGENINKQDDRGRTVLHVAAMGGQSDIVPYLLEHGANGTIKDEDGLTYDKEEEDPKVLANIVRGLLDRLSGIDEEDRAKEWVDGHTDDEMEDSVYSEYEGPFQPSRDPHENINIYHDPWAMDGDIDSLISELDTNNQIPEPQYFMTTGIANSEQAQNIQDSISLRESEGGEEEQEEEQDLLYEQMVYGGDARYEETYILDKHEFNFDT